MYFFMCYKQPTVLQVVKSFFMSNLKILYYVFVVSKMSEAMKESDGQGLQANQEGVRGAEVRVLSMARWSVCHVCHVRVPCPFPMRNR